MFTRYLFTCSLQLQDGDIRLGGFATDTQLQVGFAWLGFYCVLFENHNKDLVSRQNNIDIQTLERLLLCSFANSVFEQL